MYITVPSISNKQNSSQFSERLSWVITLTLAQTKFSIFPLDELLVNFFRHLGASDLFQQVQGTNTANGLGTHVYRCYCVNTGMSFKGNTEFILKHTERPQSKVFNIQKEGHRVKRVGSPTLLLLQSRKSVERAGKRQEVTITSLFSFKHLNMY